MFLLIFSLLEVNDARKLLTNTSIIILRWGIICMSDSSMDNVHIKLQIGIHLECYNAYV